MTHKYKYPTWIALLIMILTLGSCHVIKKTVGVTKSITPEESWIRNVIHSQPDWKYLEMRISGKATDDEDKISFLGTIRIENNRQIFISLRSMIGFEVAKIYGDRDSVWINSKLMNIKEKGDWGLIALKLGYPLNFNSIQGILTQSLFSGNGNQATDLISDLMMKEDSGSIHLVTDSSKDMRGVRFINDFKINKDDFSIDDVKIKDINGQWITDIKYLYNAEKIIKKINGNSLDTKGNYSVEINVIKKDFKDNIEINFDKF